MMQDAEKLTILKNLLGDTVKYANDEFATENRNLLNSYNQEKYGNEEDGRSQVVASDHYDTVESDMPGYARVFLGANKVLEFQPLSEGDAEEAKQKTDYADYIIRQQPDSFKVLHDWLKEPGLAKASVVKFYCEEKEKAKYVYYENLSEDEMVVVVEDLEGDSNVSKVEIESKLERDDNKFDVRFRVVRPVKRIVVVNVPVNSFIISRGADNKDTAPIIGDECIKKKFELIQDGFSEELVKSLPISSKDGKHTDMQRRFEGQGGWDQQSGYHWHFDEVTVQNLYPLMDVDEDGIPERRMIMKCGEKILSDEPYGIAPYAILSQVLMPHAAIGKSRGEQAAQYQKEKTAIKRGMNDNIYAVNRPGHAVDASSGKMGGSKVDIDEMLTHRISRVVRTDGNPYDKIMQLETPYIGDKALQVIQYIDTQKSGTLGSMLANQGLTSDKFYQETATRFEGVEAQALAKSELVCRVYAETGWRELYEGVIWTAQHYQDEETEIMVLGKPLIVDPRKWRFQHYAQSNIGLGAGDSAETLENLGVMLNTMNTMKASGSPLVDDQKLYNIMEDIVRATGKPMVSRYFNNPEQPEELVLAMNEQLIAQVEQLSAQLQNPLAEAEAVKAQSRERVEAFKSQLRVQEQSEKSDKDMALKMMEMAQEDGQFRKTMIKDLTELELKYQQNVPGAAV